jgi:CBS domain-containing protein
MEVHMRADATMTRDVIAVPPEMTLDSAWLTMATWRIRHLPVVQTGILVGMISDRDLLARGTRREDGSMKFGDEVLGEAMTLSPLACPATTPVAWIARQMVDRKIDAMPIIDAGDRVIGLVTSSDLLELLIRPDEDRVLPFQFHLRHVDSAGELAA